MVIAWMGSSFKVADKIGILPLMEFARAAEDGMDTTDMHALVTMYDMLQQCIDETDWSRWKQHALKVNTGPDEVFDVVKLSLEALTRRPTQRPFVSSDGPPTTNENSQVDSTSRVLQRLEGRPDLKLAVAQAQGLADSV
jgi:hypothetical protein